MLDKNTLIKVTNRDGGSVGYTIPDLNNLHRDFAPGETKEITMEELRKLSYISGGYIILKDYLILDNKEAIEELLNEVEPEYYYTEEDVKELLLNGSVDALKDCIDYAPAGTIDLVKKLAVDLKINNIEKRKAILEMTGFSVDSAIMVNEETDETNQENEKTRRITSQKEEEITENKISGRRVQPTIKIVK